MMSSNLEKHIKIKKYEFFSDIGKENPTLQDKNIIVNQEGELFMNLFCSSLGGNKDHKQVPIFLNLSDLQNVSNEIQFDKDGALDKEALNNYKEKRTTSQKDKTMVDKVKQIYRECMPVFRVRENPNKFLSEALKQRKQKFFFIKHANGSGRLHDLSNQLDEFYMGLDRVAQFLNFCVMLQQMPIKQSEQIQDTNQTQLLEFEPKVLAELLKQCKEERDELDKTFKGDERSEYENELKELRKQYNDYYLGEVYNGQSGFMPFAKWIRQEKVEFKCETGRSIRIPNGLIPKYFQGGGITDKDKLTKLLKLDAVLQAEKAIDQFIDNRAVDSQILSWFQDLWNSIVRGTFIADKWGWFFKENKVQLKSNQIIPDLTSYENSKTVEKHVPDESKLR